MTPSNYSNLTTCNHLPDVLNIYFFTSDHQLLDVFSSKDHLSSAGENEREKSERETETEEARETMEQWSRAYASHEVHKPHHFIGSISEIIKKLPEGLQISRVSQEINSTVIYACNTFAYGLLMVYCAVL